MRLDDLGNDKKLDEVSLGDYRTKAAKQKALSQMGAMFGRDAEQKAKDLETYRRREAGLNRVKNRDEAARQAAQKKQMDDNIARLPELRAEYEDMKKKYKSLGGSNWQYADREQNLTDYERKARDMEGSMNNLWRTIQAAERAQRERSVNEMDSQGYRGSRYDDEANQGKEGTGQVAKPADVVKHGADILNRAMDKSHRVQDRKTGKWYDPDEEFDKLKNSPDFIGVMKRMSTREGVAEGWDPDTTRLEQDVRDALDNGDDYTAKQYAKMAPTPEAKKYLLNIIKQAMYIDDLGGEIDWKGVSEAGNKPVEKYRLGMGDNRTARELKTQMQGASDEFVNWAAKDVGPFHSRVAKMQGKLAKSELRRRAADHDRLATGTNEGVAGGSLEEVSQDTARSYAQKAQVSQKDLINQTYRKGADTDKLNKKIQNRQQGLNRAHTDKRYYKDEQGVAEDSDPCWDNYKQIGMKTKNGKKVPNCVPKEGVAEGTEQVYNILALDKGNALKKPTKLKWKASSLEDIFDALAAQDWYPLEINGVEVIAGKRLKPGVAEDGSAIRRAMEAVDAEQRKAKQVPAEEMPKKTSPVLGKKEKQHPFKGRAVGGSL